MISYTVYIHTTPDSRKYVGMTNCNPRDRWSNGRGYTQKVFGSAIEEFGWEEKEPIEIEIIPYWE